MNIAGLVDHALRAAAIPIDGIATGSPETDRAQWTIQFSPSATPAHRTQAATILSTVAVDAAAQAAQDQKDAQIQVDTLPIWAKAIVLALIDQLNVIRAALPVPKPDITPAQAIAAIRAKAGTL